MPREESSAPRISRAGHKKSRRGCLRCKARRVKCDEQRPCHNCVRHKVECSLLQSIPSRDSTTLAIYPRPPLQAHSASSNGSSNGRDDGAQRSHPENASPLSALAAKAMTIKKLADELEAEIESRASQPSSSPADHGPQSVLGSTPILSPDWMKSLQLLNHYYTSTCLTLHHDAATLHLWREVVPGIAVQHELLMHGLLAISALHYAHVHPDERNSYITLSSYHQDRALDFFANKLTSINDSNCEAFFFLAIFVFLLATWSIANPQDPNEPATLETVVQCFALVQGVKFIIEYPTANRWTAGPLAPLFQRWDPPPLDPTRPFAKRIAKLAALAQTVAAEDPASAELCVSGVESLRKAYALHRSGYSGRHRTWMWPVEQEKERFDLTHCRHPVALVVLAHCAAMIKSCEGPAWVWDGWSESVVHMAERELDRRWHGWLDWPLRVVHEGLDVDDLED